ncbi:MAG: hypothetical protein EHM47_18615, partial [Ignavibacteriales bacterium]
MKKFFLFIIVFLSVSFPQQFRFAVWGDSQFQNPEVFEETVRRTELLKPDFVIHVGDMIHGYTYSIETARRQWKRFQKQIEPLSVPFYPTPGNHDVTTKEIQPAYLEAWGRNKLYYSFDYENSHFIILNTGLDQNFDSIPPVEMNWLKKDLERSKNKKNIFISMHSPLHLNSDYNWKPVHDLLRKYPVKAVFTGHYHFYDFREIDGIEYYCLNSSGNMGVYNEAAGSSHHFLWITVDGNNINTTVVTKTNMYPHDYMLGMKSQISPLMLEKDATIVIADPSAGIDTTVTLILTNNSDMNKKFIIRPLTNDYRWKFPWNGYSVNVNPGSKEELDMKIIFEGGKTEPGDLPSVEIKTKYYLQENKVSEHEYHLYLFSPPVIT